MIPLFFKNPASLRSWFEKNHENAKELWIGYYKKSSGKESMTWMESVEVAICFGWIDGIRVSVDEDSYANRFTPRKHKSSWSLRNIKTANKLVAEGKMHPAGMKAFQRRSEQNSEVYSFEQQKIALSDEFEQLFMKNIRAWTFYTSQPPSYRRTSAYWIMSAKQEKTRLKRLNDLIIDSENGRKIKPLRRKND